MRIVKSNELNSIGGGDHWGYEGSDGKVPAYLESWAANSYQNQNGSWGPSETVTKICYDVSLGVGSSEKCQTSDGKTSSETCVGKGLSVTIGGIGIGAKTGICSETVTRY